MPEALSPWLLAYFPITPSTRGAVIPIKEEAEEERIPLLRASMSVTDELFSPKMLPSSCWPALIMFVVGVPPPKRVEALSATGAKAPSRTRFPSLLTPSEDEER